MMIKVVCDVCEQDTCADYVTITAQLDGYPCEPREIHVCDVCMEPHGIKHLPHITNDNPNIDYDPPEIKAERARIVHRLPSVIIEALKAYRRSLGARRLYFKRTRTLVQDFPAHGPKVDKDVIYVSQNEDRETTAVWFVCPCGNHVVHLPCQPGDPCGSRECIVSDSGVVTIRGEINPTSCNLRFSIRDNIVVWGDDGA